MFKNKWSLIRIITMTTLSLVMLFFIYIMKGRVGDLAGAQSNTTSSVLQNISNGLFIKSNMIYFILIIFTLTSQAVVSYIHFTKAINKRHKVFAGLSIIGGGMGLHLLFLLLFIPIKTKKEYKKKNIFKGASIIGSIVVLPLPLMFLAMDFKDNDVDPNETLHMSSDKSAVNLVEIYTDAFDKEFAEKMFADNKDYYKDFDMFNNFLTSGQGTDKSMITIHQGFNNTPFHIRARNKNGSYPFGDYLNQVYTEETTKAYAKHMEVEDKEFQDIYTGGYTNFANTGEYAANATGNKAFVKKYNKKDRGMNWISAKRWETKGWGITSKAPDTLIKDATMANIEVNNNSLGGHLYLQNLIVHGPLITTKDGKISYKTTSPQTSYLALNIYIKSVIDSLKKKGVYDNTMIMIYGDHASHQRESWTVEKLGKFQSKKTSSFLAIKYPGANLQKYKEHKDKIVYAPYLNLIIKNYFHRRSVGASTRLDALKFFNKTAFARNHKYPVFLSDTKMILVGLNPNDTNDEVMYYQDDTFYGVDKNNKPNKYYAYDDTKTVSDLDKKWGESNV